VYTPLHGVGTPYIYRAFECMGLPAPLIVPDQAYPDPDFPTVPFPNPEEGEGVWQLAYDLGATPRVCIVVPLSTAHT
jgi:phosphomannomutase